MHDSALSCVQDEDVQMTQETITNFKCPLLQADMTERGEMRPVHVPSCNNARCVFSFAGITQ